MKDKELEELAVGRRNLPDGLQVRTFYVDELEEYIAQERRKAKIEVLEEVIALFGGDITLSTYVNGIINDLAELKEDNKKGKNNE